MARRKLGPADQLIRDPMIFGAIVLAIALLFLPLLWKVVIILISVLIIGSYIAINLNKINRLRQTGIEVIDQMSGKRFERRAWILFKDLGYKVTATPISGDWGADLIIEKDGVKTAVQLKCYQAPVGVQAVQEAVTAQAKYNCSRSMVVTNSTYTAQARELAYHNQTELWDREKLIAELTRAKSRKS